MVPINLGKRAGTLLRPTYLSIFLTMSSVKERQEIITQSLTRSSMDHSKMPTGIRRILRMLQSRCDFINLLSLAFFNCIFKILRVEEHSTVSRLIRDDIIELDRLQASNSTFTEDIPDDVDDYINFSLASKQKPCTFSELSATTGDDMAFVDFRVRLQRFLSAFSEHPVKLKPDDSVSQIQHLSVVYLSTFRFVNIDSSKYALHTQLTGEAQRITYAAVQIFITTLGTILSCTRLLRVDSCLHSLFLSLPVQSGEGPIP